MLEQEEEEEEEKGGVEEWPGSLREEAGTLYTLYGEGFCIQTEQ